MKVKQLVLDENSVKSISNVFKKDVKEVYQNEYGNRIIIFKDGSQITTYKNTDKKIETPKKYITKEEQVSSIMETTENFQRIITELRSELKELKNGFALISDSYLALQKAIINKKLLTIDELQNELDLINKEKALIKEKMEYEKNINSVIVASRLDTIIKIKKLDDTLKDDANEMLKTLKQSFENFKIGKAIFDIITRNIGIEDNSVELLNDYKEDIENWKELETKEAKEKALAEIEKFKNILYRNSENKALTKEEAFENLNKEE